MFSSGYLANLGAVTALAGDGALVVSDAQNHASLVDACRLARGEVVVTPHRDVDAVDRALAGRGTERAVVVTDAVFSVDGDLAPLAALHRVARAHGALLVVDEAHGLGVVGRRPVAARRTRPGIAGEPDVVLTVTLSKSLGSQGGAVLGDPVVVEHLVNTARSFIFDTGLAPAAAAGALRRARRCCAPSPRWPAGCGPGRAELAAALGAAGLPVTEPAGRGGVGARRRPGPRGRRRRRAARRRRAGRLLPAAVGARRRLPAAADRPRRPHRRRGGRAVAAVRAVLGQPAAV